LVTELYEIRIRRIEKQRGLCSTWQQELIIQITQHQRSGTVIITRYL